MFCLIFDFIKLPITDRFTDNQIRGGPDARAIFMLSIYAGMIIGAFLTAYPIAVLVVMLSRTKCRPRSAPPAVLADAVLADQSNP